MLDLIDNPVMSCPDHDDNCGLLLGEYANLSYGVLASEEEAHHIDGLFLLSLFFRGKDNQNLCLGWTEWEYQMGQFQV